MTNQHIKFQSSKYFAYVAIFLTFGFFLSQKTNAQITYDNEEIQRATAQIQELRKGVLVLILKTEYQKLSHYKAILDNPKSSKKQQKKARKLIDKTENQRTYFNEQLMEAMAFFYTFSDYRVIYDTDTDNLRANKLNHIFLNAAGERDSSISLDLEQPLYIMNEGYTIGAENNLYALQIFSFDRTPVTKPFPYYVKLSTGPVALLNLISGQPDVRPLSIVISRLNTKLLNAWTKLK